MKKQAKEKLRELRQVAKTDLTKYLVTPEQEFVESSVILALVTESKIPSRKELGVSPSSYVLGLLDAIGELKRTVFDSIRKSDAKTAESMFSAMQRLYVLISPLSVYDNIAQGVKRKLDVARILIEDTRAAVTEDARRREFISAVNRLSERLNEELERSK